MIRKTLKAVLMASALSAAVFASAPAFAAGKLTVSSPQDPGSWDPIDTFLVNWASVATNIFDGLVYRGPDLKIVPALAASWDELDEIAHWSSMSAEERMAVWALLADRHEIIVEKRIG